MLDQVKSIMMCWSDILVWNLHSFCTSDHLINGNGTGFNAQAIIWNSHLSVILTYVVQIKIKLTKAEI